VLVVGKGGVGKSSTVNSIVGERVTVVSAFQVTGYVHRGRASVCCDDRMVAEFSSDAYEVGGVFGTVRDVETASMCEVKGGVYAEHHRHPWTGGRRWH
jgi:GTPase SAR1 family protein